jgi:hypothetical protein
VARIIVASYVVRLPVGGYQSWVLQWLLGFRRLGHEVWFVEKSGWPDSCLDPATWIGSDDCSAGTQSWNALLARHGLENNWCFVDAAGCYHGVSRDRIESVFRTADLFLDMVRICEWPEESSWAAVTAQVDGEPGMKQMRMEQMVAKGMPLHQYDHYFTVGLNVGQPGCRVPTAGKQWKPTFDPVVMDLFPAVNPPADAPYTTIMAWESHAPVEFQGQSYGSKNAEFPAFFGLPSLVQSPLELAISGDAPHSQLLRAGWRLCGSGRATASFDRWLDYIRKSRGEFAVSKSYFVATNSGAFSDRSAAYLAMGRPVVMQDTGFSAHLPCGRGLFAFGTVDEAAAAIDAIDSDYTSHSRWARELAREYLSIDVVLPRLLKDVGL